MKWIWFVAPPGSIIIMLIVLGIILHVTRTRTKTTVASNGNPKKDWWSNIGPKSIIKIILQGLLVILFFNFLCLAIYKTYPGVINLWYTKPEQIVPKKIKGLERDFKTTRETAISNIAEGDIGSVTAELSKLSKEIGTSTPNSEQLAELKKLNNEFEEKKKLYSDGNLLKSPAPQKKDWIFYTLASPEIVKKAAKRQRNGKFVIQKPYTEADIIGSPKVTEGGRYLEFSYYTEEEIGRSRKKTRYKNVAKLELNDEGHFCGMIEKLGGVTMHVCLTQISDSAYAGTLQKFDPYDTDTEQPVIEAHLIVKG